MKLFFTLLFLIFTSSSIYSQAIDNETYATSLNDLYEYKEEYEYLNRLDFVLSSYFKIKYSIIINDPYLKEKLVYEFLELCRDKGYKIPKKIKSKDFFNPFDFILDLKINFNKEGEIIDIRNNS